MATDMTACVLSSYQREILEALASRWELIRWRCLDGRQRWHMGEGEVDGRAVRGLQRRGLNTWSDGYDRLVLTDRGKAALGGARSAAGSGG